MSVTLTPAPLFGVHSSFHYTEDNDRLTQLNINDQLLADQVNQILGGANGSMVATGNWSSISIKLDTTDIVAEQHFGMEIKVWGVENLASTTSPNAFLFSTLIFGYKDISNNLQLINTSLVYSQNVGNKIVTPVVSLVTNEIYVKATGFTGTNGKMSCRVSNFG